MSISSSSAGIKLLLLTALAGAGLVAGATAATVYAAGDGQRRSAGHADSARALSADAGHHWEPVRALADSLAAPLGPATPLDSATLAQMVALVSSPADSATWIAHPIADTSLAAAMPVFRRWARAEPLPAFWGLRAGFPGLRDSRGLPMPRLSLIKQLWRASEADADSALLRGDTATALQRAREIIAGSRHLAWQPRPIDALVGRVMLADGAKLLARSALQADQPSLHSAALRLQQLTQAMQPVGAGLWQLPGGEANEARLRDIARDRAMHPAARLVAIERMIALSCLTTRDVLFGPSAVRRTNVVAMIREASDIPRLAELRPAFLRTLTTLDETPELFMTAPNANGATNESAMQSLLRLVVPRKVQARIDACRYAGA